MKCHDDKVDLAIYSLANHAKEQQVAKEIALGASIISQNISKEAFYEKFFLKTFENSQSQDFLTLRQAKGFIST